MQLDSYRPMCIRCSDKVPKSRATSAHPQHTGRSPAHGCLSVVSAGVPGRAQDNGACVSAPHPVGNSCSVWI
ncbi:hypothetical protein GN956_G14097 [Arapaima gigas]